MPGIGVGHDGMDLTTILKLRPHMRVNGEANAFVSGTSSNLVQHYRHMLQVLGGCARLPARAHVDLEMLAIQKLDEPDEPQMLLDDLFVTRGIFKVHLH